MNSFLPIILPAIFIIFMGFVVFVMFNRRAKNVGIEIIFGGKVIEDLGEIAENQILFGHQKLQLLKCQKDNEVFYVIEVRQGMPGSYKVFWAKVDSEAVSKIGNLITK